MTQHPQRCEHYDVCWFQCQHHRCINDNPDDIPCIFDTRKGVNFTVYFGRGDIALTEIEIALRKEENPSEEVQWAIERINRLQKEWEATHNTAASGREQVLETFYDRILDESFSSNRGVIVIELKRISELYDELKAELRKQGERP